jgi:3-deoxy-D-manno-octulosonic-acid transferase
VGEVRAATRLVKEMRQKHGVEVVFSTMTSAGQSVARNSLREPSHFFFLPLDVPFVVARALERIKADVLLLVETELWPCLILEAKRRDMKVAVVNGKISARGLRGYRRFAFVFGPVVRMLDAVMVQSTRHGLNYESLGVPAARVAMTGSTKQDIQPRADGELALRERVGWSASEVVLVAGSTRPGEERILCEGFARARAACDKLRLVMAPRHLRRSANVARVAASYGLAVARWSGLKTDPSGPVEGGVPARADDRVDVLILDTIGDLLAAYGESDIAFIGGTLSGHGGHNVLEPAAAGLPILAGSSIENIEDDCNALGEAGALVTIHDSSDVERELKSLTDSSQERQRRGNQAAVFFRSRPVASLLTLEHLERAGIV